MIRYVQLNPKRLATKRLKPEYMLILSPWEYDPMQKHVSRAKCVEMNNIAEEICRI